MKPEQVDSLNAILETIDRRLGSFGERFVNVEANMAESASATDRIAENVHKLSELYVSLDRNFEDLKTVMQNYVDAVRAREQQSRRTEDAARGLVSEVRERFPKAAEG